MIGGFTKDEMKTKGYRISGFPFSYVSTTWQ